jgi:hypothetical protein
LTRWIRPTEEVISTELKRGGLAGALSLTVVALLAVTALASRAPLSNAHGLISGGPAPRTSASPWAIGIVGLGAVIALIGIAVHFRWQVPRRRTPEPYRTQYFRVPFLAKVVALLIPLALAAALVVGAIEGSDTHQIRPLGRAAPPGVRAPTRPHPAVHTSFALPGWVPFTILGLVLAGLGTVLLVLWLSDRRQRLQGAGLRAAADPLIGEAVELSLEDLRADPDHRRAVIAAYARMEAALAAAGLPRRPAEAPREYLTRALDSLELSTGPIKTLTAIFEHAKFSVARLDARLRDQAISALVALREELG